MEQAAFTPTSNMRRVMRAGKVHKHYDVARSTTCRWFNEPDFPAEARIRVSPKVVLIDLDATDAWLRSRSAK